MPTRWASFASFCTLCHIFSLVHTNEECCSIYNHHWHLLVDLMDGPQALPAFITDMNDVSDIFHCSLFVPSLSQSVLTNNLVDRTFLLLQYQHSLSLYSILEYHFAVIMLWPYECLDLVAVHFHVPDEEEKAPDSFPFDRKLLSSMRLTAYIKCI